MSADKQSENDQRPMAELMSFVTYRISQLHPKLNSQAAYILRKHGGLSLIQWRTIALIHAMGPNVSSTEIIKRVDMDKGLFSRNVKTLIAAGGVSANKQLRAGLQAMMAERGGQVFFPRPEFCTDNGAMIAYAGCQHLQAGHSEGLAFAAYPRWPLAE